MAFVAVPAGSFRMGTDAADAELKTARPAHTVTLSRPFWMSRTPVTVAQFRAFAAATGYRTDAETGGGSSICTDGHWLMEPDATWRDPHVPQDDDCPVSCMSWNDAQAMVHWLDENNPRLGFRLPTEAEWEYACRAGTTGARYGDLGAIAWYGGNSGGRPHPVAQKQANAFGLYDMVGNVWQWVQDWDGADYYAASPPVDPQGPTTGTLRAIRAGSWLEGANCASAEFRHPGAPPAGRTFNLGFRLVAVPR
jgi:formylglycine-generating enzyme required for sulfatase activity